MLLSDIQRLEMIALVFLILILNLVNGEYAMLHYRLYDIFENAEEWEER